MPIYTLERHQTIPASLDEAWSFFSNPCNLPKITPPHLGFRVLSPPETRMRAGMVIAYQVRPLLGIPMSWLTEITHVAEGDYFVDEQRHGPYKVWHHEHFFRQTGPRQVEIQDRVTYIPPMGPLGGLVHPWLIRPQLEKIFAYRHQAVERLFPAS